MLYHLIVSSTTISSIFVEVPQVAISYDKHALWGISHWGSKRQQFYGFAVNRESARDAYSKRRIIAVTELKIVEWHNYKHLDWIMVRRDDNKLYKCKEGDFKRLRIQDIEDMLLLLVQGKLKNLTVEERFAFNISLRIFTRSIVIQRRVEDLQLDVKSYQKNLNLTRPDTYRSDLKRKEAYIAYSNPRGFIYQNKHKQNKLMPIDELHQFSDGTLIDVRTVLDDRLKEKDFKISELEECVRNKDLEIEKCLERLNVCENKLHKLGQTNQTVHMIMPSKDNLYNGRKEIGFENPRYFKKAKDFRPTLYDEKVIGLGYTPMFLTHSDEALEIEKFKRSRENKIEFAYDYGNLNTSYVNEKINFEDDFFQDIINPDFDRLILRFNEVVNLLEKEKANLETIESLKSKGFELSESAVSESENQNENDCHKIEKVCDKEENPKVIAPGMFKLNVSSPILMSKSLCDSNNVEIKLKTKRRKRKSSKQNVKQVDNDVSCANSDFVQFSDLDTFSSVRRPKNISVVWKKKESSNTSNVGLSAVSISNLNKNVKRYSRKDLLACNNYHLGEISSASVCSDAMNVSCDSRMNDLLDDNKFFIFDDVNVRISPVSKMPFRKKPRDSMHVLSKSNMIKSLPRTIVQICLWIIDSGCSKHMMGNRPLLTNFVEKFLGTVRFGNNDFAVIAGYGDVVIGSMTIKKGLEVAFRKSTCFVRNEDGVNLLTGDRSSNLYTIALNEVATNSSTCLLAKDSSSQSWLWHQHHLCSACEQGKIHRKHHKSKTAFASSKPLYLLHMDLCGPMRVQSINGKRYVLVVVDDYSSYTWAEAIAIACFTQNRSIIHKRFDKTPYELINKRKPNIKFFLVFEFRCYLLNDYEDVGKRKAKGDIGVFVGYSKESAAFRI
nr:hypothetical protein [Tanacetum cinerariifolium]